MVAVPAVGRTRPSSMRSVVVLPLPFGPRKPVIRPDSTVKVSSSTAVKVPNRLVSPAISIRPGPRSLGGLMGCPFVVVAGPMQPHRPTVERAIDEGDARAHVVLQSLKQLSTQLSAAQVGITITTLVVGYLAQPSIGALLSGPLAGLGLSAGAVEAVSSSVALLIATVFSMIFGELLPQFLGISAPLPTAKVVALPVRVFAVVAKPLIIVLNGSANAFLRGLGIEPQEELSGARTPQELASLVQRSAEAGTLDITTARMLTRSLGFGERTADDVMTPRVRCTGIHRDESADDVLRLSRRTGHSRFPVLGEDWDDVDGVVHVKKAMAVPHERRKDVPVSALMSDRLVVPETIRLDPLLRELR